MLHLSDEAWKAVSAFVVAICATAWAALTKRAGRISERRETHSHQLRREKYEYMEAYSRLHTLADQAALCVTVAAQLKKSNVEWGRQLETLEILFPNGQVPDFLSIVKTELSKAESLQRQLGTEAEEYRDNKGE